MKKISIIGAFTVIITLVFTFSLCANTQDTPPIELPQNTEFIASFDLPQFLSHPIVQKNSAPVMKIMANYTKFLPDAEDALMCFSNAMLEAKITPFQLSKTYFIAPKKQSQGFTVLHSTASLEKLKNFAEKLIRLPDHKYLFEDIEIENKKGFSITLNQKGVYWIEHAPSVYFIVTKKEIYSQYLQSPKLEKEKGMWRIIPENNTNKLGWFASKTRFGEVLSANGVISNAQDNIECSTFLHAQESDVSSLFQKLNGKLMIGIIALSGKYPDLAKEFQENTTLSKGKNHVKGTLKITPKMIQQVLKTLPMVLPSQN